MLMQSLSSNQSKFAGFIKKIVKKNVTICVIGLGQIGLPISLSFLKENFKVIGYDVNESLVRNLLKGICQIREKGFGELITEFIRQKSFSVTVSPDGLDEADVIIICVPTPLAEREHRPNLTSLQKALYDVARYLTRSKLIIVESSIPPGTMTQVIIPLIEWRSGKKAGIDFLVSYCPERTTPGNALREFTDNPRIIGTIDELSYVATLSLFKSLSRGQILRADPTVAEISKLAENSYRDLNIAFANELAIMCEQLGVDVLEVIRMANTHPRVNIHKPGPGVGGPCLPKDPYLLLNGKKKLESSLIGLARNINDSMPTHVANLLLKNTDLNRRERKETKILILGASYKADINDVQYSPARGIILALKKEGFTDITVHDPYTNISFNAEYTPDMYSILFKVDCVIIATGHSLFSTLSPRDFKEGCMVVDTVRILNKTDFFNTGRIYVGLGT